MEHLIVDKLPRKYAEVLVVRRKSARFRLTNERYYVDLDGIRLVFDDGELIGWYRPGDKNEDDGRCWYFFTFCLGDLLRKNRYAKFYGTYEEARSQMVERYGLAWAFQYSEKNWANGKHIEKEWRDDGQNE